MEKLSELTNEWRSYVASESMIKTKLQRFHEIEDSILYGRIKIQQLHQPLNEKDEIYWFQYEIKEENRVTSKDGQRKKVSNQQEIWINITQANHMLIPGGIHLLTLKEYA